ncbi:hypothetical protein GUJ93_ZPchr0817g46486, partial [Zizania palustris]
EISASSTWDDSKALFEDSQEYRALGSETYARELFEECVVHLKERLKEKERLREEEKAKKERGHEMDIDAVDADSHGLKDKKREKDKEKKHKRRYHDTADDVSSERDEKDDSKKSRRHSSDRKKSRKPTHASDSDSENRHKRHKKDQDSSRRNGARDDLEDEKKPQFLHEGCYCERYVFNVGQLEIVSG